VSQTNALATLPYHMVCDASQLNRFCWSRSTKQSSATTAQLEVLQKMIKNSLTALQFCLKST
jgi:hypothetical protein